MAGLRLRPWIGGGGGGAAGREREGGAPRGADAPWRGSGCGLGSGVAGAAPRNGRERRAHVVAGRTGRDLQRSLILLCQVRSGYLYGGDEQGKRRGRSAQGNRVKPIRSYP